MDKRGLIQTEIKYALDRFEEKLAGDIYLIPVRLEEIELPERLAEIQWVDWFAKDGWTRLKKAIESQGFPGSRQAVHTCSRTLDCSPRHPPADL